ncbi:UvrD-like Helicase, ATP-binding domain, P-loop containing nucleoside triphosphate hydrolase [Melia azedarach]|uniref:UvrD-like Helicase, ATP-binding domain, P-loop containing nucleoside triphosphate hydrolase n=1 Tax=Melia azedarach TaxID=155640 RepID=A0ACC1XG32_MELAZ|nr:UvrD-like Helicase, ATP-binding domain, P-loop containing nucleoside triphosphate hydrolase [Melia azedarach]
MMEGEGTSNSSKKKAVPNDYGFTDTLFSWSLEDIFNNNLLTEKVEKIPSSFQSVEQYFRSFVFPLLEETRAQLCSSMETISTAPFAEVVAFEESKPYGTKLYDVKVDNWKNRFSNHGKEPYKTLPGDILVLADAKPETADDLQRVGRVWSFVSVIKVPEDEDETDTTSTCFKVQVGKDIQVDDNRKSLYVIFLLNILPNRRIWISLHRRGNLRVIKEILCTDAVADKEYELYPVQSEWIWHEISCHRLLSVLNDSQLEAVYSCLSRMHSDLDHKASVDLIWGPPGTGKTKTVSMLVFILLKLNCRTLVCAPTNVAIKEVASRILTLVKESVERDSHGHTLFYPLGEILLFGNNERLKVDAGIEEIYLDYRIKRLAECFAPLTGWRHCFAAMIDFLEDCVSQYHIFLENELMKEGDANKHEIKERESRKEIDGSKPFLQFMRERFKCTATQLRNCIFNLGTHIPKSFILENNFQDMVALINSLDSLETLLFQDCVVSEEIEELFSHPAIEDYYRAFFGKKYLLHLHQRRSECHSVLRNLRSSFNDLDLPSAMNKEFLKDFCLRTASLIFCTACSSFKLHSVAMEPLKFLVIDEAAQLKESESTIPLQLRGIKHAILIGDNCQLPAMVESNVSDDACFGRSLFERLSYLGHSKHLLSMQYRMHPSISFFPNLYFYDNKIVDAPDVEKGSYEKHYLPGPMYGPYSFINIFGGREEFTDSYRNMVEVSAVMKILQNLYKAWSGSKQKISVGILSPYSAQVGTIQEKLESKYENKDGFSVKVKSIDGFHGGEEDIIIMSAVRSNRSGSIGFLSKPQRVNVALTRARHCLWILGNARTLTRTESVWDTLVRDAKARHCFFNADEDKDLAKAILEVKKEFDELDELLNGESILFRSQRWKVIFSDNFLKSFKKLTSGQTKGSVINLLLKLSSGWQPKKRNIDLVCERSLHIIKQFKVESLYIICTIDVMKELQYIQVLKVWDILPLENVPKLATRLDNIFVKYTDDYINCCKEKSFEGNLEVPKTWAASSNIVRFKNVADNGSGSDLTGAASDSSSYIENSKVTDSLLLMKFYSLSRGVVSHLLSDRDGRELDLPFEVTDEQLEIILSPRSTFILGRSGTGKTTVLTMKLFQREKLHHMVEEGSYGVNKNTPLAEDNVGKRDFLRQLFVTVSPKLCFAVKQHISQMKSSAFGGEFPAESSLVDVDDINDAAQFKDIQNSFVDIPAKSFPLVITFHKFLMMLDGTLGNSYFERFHDIDKHSAGWTQHLRLVSLQNFIRAKEVTYEKFSSSYWPHFNSQLTKKLDSSRVFTEIISHIKGSLQSMEVSHGKLSREDYVQLSESRVSTLRRQKRERIFDIFESYEQMKMRNGEFDLADLVNDLHRRLKSEHYKGDGIHFVYVDEVQDLTMSQIALFKYICKNAEEGFVFSGDTAQTVARGIDFRFQDIRSLFYKKFVLESKNIGNDGRKEKGQLSDNFSLIQNFRTHAGVLKLAQSIMDLLYRFFPHSVDILNPEKSFIFGEPPVLLESGNNENAIVKIFGNNGNVGGNMVGFGAEQVILVRNDCVRKDISGYVGKKALVLTIVESKGLEFQDVLLYNFFGSSPLKNQWRVIYEYMKEQNLLDSTSPRSFPIFDEAKHNVLCSELKQLYVAITRTRQRLWIWENIEELSKPMFDYWKKKLLVQVRQLDDSLAQAMQVASSPEEWKSRGIKLFYEHNYEMATICFERARDTYWEGMSKATGLKAAADRIRSSNHEEANIMLREASKIFEAIGKADSAARCFYDLGEYERAGRIYLEKCAEPELERAGECFCLAGCYELAADVYARGNFFLECLAVCFKGKLFNNGLQYINYWKQYSDTDVGLVRRSEEINKTAQDFLQSSALHYHELRDNRSMMKFIKAFHSMDFIRNFLKSLSCYDELLELEEEAGNFIDAANIAKLRGDILLTANLLQKAENFKEASMLTLNYVLSNSLWSTGSKGWPLKQFSQKEELLEKAKSLAKEESCQFYEFVCMEADILSSDHGDLLIMNQQLNASKRHQSVSGEILSSRKILDVHLRTNSSKYVLEDEVVFGLITFSEETICRNRVSVQTLVHFWNCWKDKIVNILKHLRCLKTQNVDDYRSYGDFCLSYLGVWKQYSNLNTIYLLLNSDADWVGELDKRYAQRNGKPVTVDVCQLVSAASSYWSSELLAVGMKVLNNLEDLYKQSSKNSSSVFCQVICLCYMHEVEKFLSSSKFLCNQYHEAKIRKFVKLSMEHFYDFIFPLDWRKSLRKNVISLRGTEVYRNAVQELISWRIGLKDELSYGEIGYVAVMILGSGKLRNDLYESVAKRFDGNTPWKEFVQSLSGNMDLKDTSHIKKFHGALVDTYEANWRRTDYMSPACFLYLIERILILLSSFQRYIFTTKSSFIDWLINNQEGSAQPASGLVTDIQQSLSDILEFVVGIVLQFLHEDKETVEWIKNSCTQMKDYHALVVLRLVVIVCLVHLNFGNCENILHDLLGRNYISNKLPRDFYDALRRRRNQNAIAKAFKNIGNPLVIVNLWESRPNFAKQCPDAVFVDMKGSKCKEEILEILFPVNEASQGHSGAAKLEATNLPREVLFTKSYERGKNSNHSSSNSASPQHQEMNTMDVKAGNLPLKLEQFWNIFEAFEFEDNGEGQPKFVFKSSTIKEDVRKSIQLLAAAMDECSLKNSDYAEAKSQMGEAASMIEDLKQLHAALNSLSEGKLKKISTLGEIYKKLQSRRPNMEPFLKQVFLKLYTNLKGKAVEIGNTPADSNADEGNKGKMKAIPTPASKDQGQAGCQKTKTKGQERTKH